MPWPLSQDYNEAVQTPVQSFSDADLKQAEAKANAIGIPMPCSGNFADVYELTGPGGKKWAVKCFTRQVAGLRERYTAISAYLKQVNLPFMVDFAYLEQGIRIKGQWYPILKMDWVEGFGLNQFVQEHADNPPVLELLAQIWLRLAQRLREAKMAHADLQHGNVLLVPGSQARSLAVRLIDYDGMFVPALARTKSGEVGHPAYQHPQRLRDGTYNAEVDRFPHLVIYTALRSLMVGGRYLWKKYNNGDNLLFRQADLNEPGKSALFAELLKLNDAELRKLVQTLAQAVQKPLEQTPLVDQLVSGGSASARRPSAVAADPRVEQAPGAVFAQAAGDVIRRPRRSAQRSHAGVTLAAVVALVGLAVGGFMLANRSSPKDTGAAVAVVRVSPSTPKRVESSQAEPRKDPEPAKESPPIKAPEPKTDPPAVPAGSADAIDLLKRINVQKDSVEGAWAFQGTTLVSPPVAKDRTARLLIPYEPPEEYTLRMTIVLKQGNRDFGAGLIAGGRQFVAVLNGNPSRGYESGLDQVDGKPYWKNETCAKGEVLHQDRPSAVVYTVRKTGIAVTVDGKTIIQFNGDFNRLSLAAGWTIPNPRALFVGTYLSIYHITKMELTPGHGAEPRSEPAKPPTQVATPGEIRRFNSNYRKVLSVAYSPDGKQVLSRGDETVRLWDVETGEAVREFPHPKVDAVVFSPDGLRLLSVGNNQVMRLWDAGTGKELETMTEPGGGNQTQHKVCFSPDGRHAFVQFGRPIQMWDLTKKVEVRRFTGHTDWVVGMVVSADGRRLLTASFDKTMRLWDVTTGRELNRWPHPTSVKGAAFSPDGKRAYSASQDGTIREWDLKDGRELRQFGASELSIWTMALAPDGRRLLTANRTPQSISVWDLVQGKEIHRFNTQSEPWSVAVSPDGRHAVSGHQDGTIRLWSLPAVSVVASPQDPKLKAGETITNSIGMKLARVLAGTFWMGGGGGKPGTRPVTIPHDFYLGAYPVTQGEWQTLMGKNPSYFSRMGGGRDKVKAVSDADLKQFPVEGVSWNDVQQFLQRLNQRDQQKGWLYRLPTEAEWEYACRGAPAIPEACTFDFYFDQPTNDLSSAQANFDSANPAGTAPKAPSPQRTTKVGSYPPNRLGLYDMHGNVWQWCDDWHAEGSTRNARGGTWRSSGSGCRAARRGGFTPVHRDNNIGFRVARVPSGSTDPTVKYLVDMQEFDVKEHHNPLYRFLKGMAGGKVISVDGVSSPHGLCMHPTSKSFSSAKYRISKGSKRFQAGVAINDTAAKQTVRTPVTFQVFGDGRLLWESKPIPAARQTQNCDVSLKGISVLELRVTCPGPDDAAHAVWIEPLIRN